MADLIALAATAGKLRRELEAIEASPASLPDRSDRCLHLAEELFTADAHGFLDALIDLHPVTFYQVADHLLSRRV